MLPGLLGRHAHGLYRADRCSAVCLDPVSLLSEIAPEPILKSIARGRMVVTDLEVITITPTSAVIAWTTRQSRLGVGVPQPVTAGTELALGPVNGPLRTVHDDPTPRAFHMVEVTGLEPGRRYRFKATSDGQQAHAALLPTLQVGSCEQINEFTTLTPPPGEYLTTIALTNDIHIGEKRQGIVLGSLPTSVQPHPDQVDYPQLMLSASLDDLTTRRGHPFVVVNGDITYANLPDEVELARQLLDGYGEQDADWVATRGNHDHPRRDDDPFGDVFVGYKSNQTILDPSGVRVLAMDSTRGSGGGWIVPDQYDQIMSELESDPHRPTLAVTHHPVTNEAAWTSISGPQFMLRASDRLRLQLLENQAPGVFLHVAGHTHRMRRDRADLLWAHTQYLENAACAAYPGGFSLLHLYTGGYLLNFWRPSDPDAHDWLYRSRWQVMGLGAHLMLGRTEDRNHVVEFDLSGLVPAQRQVPAELRT